MKEELDFDIFSSNYGGNITIYNPSVYAQVLNSFEYLPVEFVLDTVQFHGPEGVAPILSHYPTIIPIPVSPAQYHLVTTDALPSVSISTNYNKISLVGKAVVNPRGFDAGYLYIHEKSLISVKVGVKIPFSMKIENAFYRDTIDLKVDTIPSYLDVIKQAEMRFAFLNKLPIALKTQMYYYHEKNPARIDSIFKTPLSLYVIPENGNSSEIVQFEKLEGDQLRKFLNSNKLVLSFSFNTNNQKVDFNTNQFLGAKLGMKLRYNTSEIDIK